MTYFVYRETIYRCSTPLKEQGMKATSAAIGAVAGQQPPEWRFGATIRAALREIMTAAGGLLSHGSDQELLTDLRCRMMPRKPLTVGDTVEWAKRWWAMRRV